MIQIQNRIYINIKFPNIQKLQIYRFKNYMKKKKNANSPNRRERHIPTGSLPTMR